MSFCGGGGGGGGGVVCKVIFVSNPTTVLRLCCVVVGVVTIGCIGFPGEDHKLMSSFEMIAMPMVIATTLHWEYKYY